MAATITIRRAETYDDYRACQEAQRRAWGITEANDLVPVATMVGANLHGGLVLGAFLSDGSAVGLSFAFLGKVEGTIGLYSQLTGIVPGYQGQGVGMRLKHAQFDFARSEGIERVAWAFDPLQAGNARFNLDQLGTTAGRYIENMYGPRTDALNPCTHTDRLIAVWESHPQPRPELPEDPLSTCPRLLDFGPNPDDPPNVASLPSERPPFVLVAIPGNINALRLQVPQHAEAWRRALQASLKTAFEQGYRAVATIRSEVEDRNLDFYLLHRL